MKNINEYWAGPIPYSISKANYFRGRENELSTFLRMVSQSNLTLLTGGSGVGKSSFLYAGIIPKLKELLKETTPIFLVNSWGKKDISSQQDVLDIMRDSINENSKEEKMLSNISENGNVYDEIYNAIPLLKVDNNQEKGKGILILDQFEEVIRTDVQNKEHVFNVLKHIIKNRKEIHLIISFREEFYISFRKYESEFGGVAEKTLQLEPISKEICKTAILDKVCDVINDEAGINIERDKLFDKIIYDCSISNYDKASKDEQNHKRKDDIIDLLALQAVMIDLYANKINGYKITEVDYDSIGKNNLKTLDVKETEKLRTPSQKSLYVWFNNAVNRIIENNTNEIGEIGNKYIKPCKPILFYFIVEICPYLSSDSYKKAWVEDDLKEVLIDEDKIRKLLFAGGINISDVKEADFPQICKELNNISGISKKVFKDNFIDKVGSKTEFDSFVKELLSHLRGSFKLTIDSLVAEDIIKTSHTSNGLIYTIKHDMLGSISNIWSSINKSTFNYAQENYISTGALDIPFASETILKANNEHLKFRASYFNTPDQISNICDNKSFNCCDFTACVFEKIHFKDCNFYDCNLEGSIFIDCTFEHTEFNCCSFKGAMFKSRKLNDSSGTIINELTFYGCDVLISEINDIILEGDLTITTNKVIEKFIEKEFEESKKNTDRYIFDGDNIVREKEFSLSAIRIKEIKYKKGGSKGEIKFSNDVKSNNIMMNGDATNISKFESTKINGLSLLGG